MSTISLQTSTGPRSDRNVHFEQFPVDASILRVSFDTGSTAGDFIRIVIMNAHSTPQNAAYTEYHHVNAALSINDVSSFIMRCAPLDGAQQAIDNFVGGMPQQFSIPQSPSWCCGIHKPTADRTRLYKAPDPDDVTKMIGVMIEQDAQGRLAQITWYKTRNASALFRVTPAMLEFELVRDAAGRLSNDPNDIGGWTWYYTTSLRSGE